MLDLKFYATKLRLSYSFDSICEMEKRSWIYYCLDEVFTIVTRKRCEFISSCMFNNWFIILCASKVKVCSEDKLHGLIMYLILILIDSFREKERVSSNFGTRNNKFCPYKCLWYPILKLNYIYIYIYITTVHP